MQATSASYISHLADRRGGEACVRDSRITVWGLVVLRDGGLSDRDIINAIDGVTVDDLATAWEYATAHPEEIRRDIEANDDGEEGFVE